MSLLKIHLMKKMYAACNIFAYILILLKHLVIYKKNNGIYIISKKKTYQLFRYKIIVFT